MGNSILDRLKRINKSRVIVFATTAVLVTMALGCADAINIYEKQEAAAASSSGDGKAHELKIVTVMPSAKEAASTEYEPLYTDFDLRHLSIIRKESEYGQKEEAETDTTGYLGTGGSVEDSQGNIGSHVDSTGSDKDSGDSLRGAFGESDGEYGRNHDEDECHQEDDGYGSDYDTQESGEHTEPDAWDEGSSDEYAGYAEGDDGSESEDNLSDGDNESSEPLDGNPVGESGLTYAGCFEITWYCPNSCCCGEYATGYTASGTLATEGRTIACSLYDFGTVLYIDGLGYYVVEDRGVYGQAIDVFVNDHETALAYGLQYRDVYVVG